MDVIRVPWSSASFLAYLGGFTVLSAAGALLTVQSNDHGAGSFVLWAALIFAVFVALASAARKTGHYVIAGLLALSCVVAFTVFVGSILDWFGWLHHLTDGFDGFHFWLLVLELLALVAAVVALRIFRFPLLVFVVAVSGWYFTTDLISNGGNWSAIVTIAAGLVLLMAAVSADAGESDLNGFWLHVVSGLTLGGGLLWFFHDGDVDWILVGAASVGYIALGDRLARSSWVVLGAWGMLQTASHFADKWSQAGEGLFFPLFYLFPFGLSFDGEYSQTHEHQWIGPLIFAAVAGVFFAIALLLARRRRDTIPGAELL
jgi:hypothetical protein